MSQVSLEYTFPVFERLAVKDLWHNDRRALWSRHLHFLLLLFFLLFRHRLHRRFLFVLARLHDLPLRLGNPIADRHERLPHRLDQRKQDDGSLMGGARGIECRLERVQSARVQQLKRVFEAPKRTRGRRVVGRYLKVEQNAVIEGSDIELDRRNNAIAARLSPTIKNKT